MLVSMDLHHSPIRFKRHHYQAVVLGIWVYYSGIILGTWLVMTFGLILGETGIIKSRGRDFGLPMSLALFDVGLFLFSLWSIHLFRLRRLLLLTLKLLIFGPLAFLVFLGSFNPRWTGPAAALSLLASWVAVGHIQSLDYSWHNANIRDGLEALTMISFGVIAIIGTMFLTGLLMRLIRMDASLAFVGCLRRADLLGLQVAAVD